MATPVNTDQTVRASLYDLLQAWNDAVSGGEIAPPTDGNNPAVADSPLARHSIVEDNQYPTIYEIRANGKSTQSGEPSQLNPLPIVSLVGDMVVEFADATGRSTNILDGWPTAHVVSSSDPGGGVDENTNRLALFQAGTPQIFPSIIGYGGVYANYAYSLNYPGLGEYGHGVIVDVSGAVEEPYIRLSSASGSASYAAAGIGITFDVPQSDTFWADCDILETSVDEHGYAYYSFLWYDSNGAMITQANAELYRGMQEITPPTGAVYGIMLTRNIVEEGGVYTHEPADFVSPYIGSISGTAITIDLMGNELRGLPNGVCDKAVLDCRTGTTRIVRYVGETYTASDDGITGTPGVDCLSTTGVIENGARVLYALAEPVIITLSTAEVPDFPTGRLEMWDDDNTAVQFTYTYSLKNHITFLTSLIAELDARVTALEEE